MDEGSGAWIGMYESGSAHGGVGERGGLITPVEFGSGFREALLRPAARAGGF